MVVLVAVLLGFLMWQNWQVNVQAQTQTPQHGVTLTWNASVTPNVCYNVYRTPTAGGSYTKLNSAPVCVLTYFDPTGNLNGATMFYNVSAVDSMGVEKLDGEVSAVTISDPKAVTGLAAVAR